MHIKSSLILLISISVFLPTLAAEQNDPEGWEASIPLKFLTKKEALQKHCLFAPLKSKSQLNAICTGDSGEWHVLMVGIYDEDKSGHWVRKDLLRFPAWPGKGKLEAIDLFGDGLKCLKVIHDGNRGLGEYQSILTLVEWKEEKFIPVLMETLSFDLQSLGGGDRDHYELKYQFEKKGTDQICIKMHVRYKSIEQTFDDKLGDMKTVSNETEEWDDKVQWNEKTDSFYDSKSEEDKIKKSKYDQERKVHEIRMKFLGKRPDVYNMDYPDLDQLGIMM